MDVFDDRETKFLQHQGNEIVNENLLQNVPVWMTRPKQHNFP